jgi:drug/metabolite transporter (DMT)-like permease
MLARRMLLGILLGLGASASWALANVAVQRSARRVGTVRALLWAQVVGAALVVPLALALDRRSVAPSPADVPWVLGAGLAALLAYVCLFYAFQHGRLTIAVPIMSSWAVLAAGLSLLLFHEHVRPAQLAGAAVVVAGALVVSRYSQQQAAAAPALPGGPRWLLAALGAAVGFGLLIPAMGRLAPVVGSLGVIAVVYAADVVLGLPVALRFRIPLGPPRGDAWLAVVLAGLFETAGFACISLGARHAPLALVSPLSSLASAFTVAYAWAVLGERPAAPVLVGATLVCAGVVVLAL